MNSNYYKNTSIMLNFTDSNQNTYQYPLPDDVVKSIGQYLDSSAGSRPIITGLSAKIIHYNEANLETENEKLKEKIRILVEGSNGKFDVLIFGEDIDFVIDAVYEKKYGKK